MTREQVQRALGTAVRAAFQLGHECYRGPEGGVVKATTYANDLVMPMVDLAIEQAREEGAIAALQAAADPEPREEETDA